MRLTPIPPVKLSDEQKPVFEAMKEEIAKNFADKNFITENSEGALLGPWNPWLHSPQVGRAAVELANAVSALKGLSERVKQIVILTTGAHYNAGYEIYAHTAIARQDGIDEDTIACLAENRQPSLEGDEMLAYQTTKALLAGGALPDNYYQAIWRSAPKAQPNSSISSGNTPSCR